MESIFSSFTEPAAAMATTEPLIFVIATAAQLPQTCTYLEVLQEAQATGPSTGFALRIFSKGAEHSDLACSPLMAFSPVSNAAAAMAPSCFATPWWR